MRTLNFLALLATFLALPACGAASPATEGAYAVEQARCIANEREIIARQNTTEAEDEAAYAVEETRCDTALQAIDHSAAPAADGGV